MMLAIAALALLAQAPPDTLYREGVAALEAGRVADAAPLLEKAANTAKTNAQYWKAYGVAVASLNQYAAAVEPFEHACRLEPRLPDACYYLGRALYAADRYEAALAPLRQSLETDLDKGRAETAIAQALEALGREDEAARLYQSAISRKYQPARVAYGRFLLRAGKIEDAMSMLEGAEHPEGLLEYARALMQAGRNEAAAAKLETLIAKTPRDRVARLLLAKAYRRLGRNADAVRQEEAAKALQGSSTER